MAEHLRNGDSAGVRNLRVKFVECVGQLEFPFLDELKDHHRRIHLCDRADPVFRRRRERFLIGPGDLAVAEGVCVKNVAVFGDGQAAQPLVLFEDPIESWSSLALSSVCAYPGVRDASVSNAINRSLASIVFP